MATRYIADLHLFDVYSLGWRDYLDTTLEGYASLLIDNWNSVTQPDDIVIVAGDVGRYCNLTLMTLQRLNGIKILIVGNHDISWGSALYDSRIFAGTHEFIFQNGIYVQHTNNIPDAMRKQASYIVHGHHHRYDVPGMQQHLRHYNLDVCRLNCAADLIGHKPRTLQELVFQKELLLEKMSSMNLI